MRVFSASLSRKNNIKYNYKIYEIIKENSGEEREKPTQVKLQHKTGLVVSNSYSTYLLQIDYRLENIWLSL